MYRILIADDEPIECRALQHKLESHFSELEILPCAANGIELIRSVETCHPDIIIVDINMPGLGGLDAVEILKMKEKHVKIVIHTAYSHFEYAKRAIDLGASAYVLKPDVDDEMLKVIAELCTELKKKEREEEERREGQKEFENLRDIAAKKWFLSLYMGEPDEECWHIFQKYVSGAEHGGFLAVWKINPGKGNTPCSTEQAQQCVITHMKELCSCVEYLYKEDLVFLVMTREREIYQKWYRELCSCIFHELEQKHIAASVGVSRWKRTGEEFSSGIFEASSEARKAENYEVSFFQYGKRDVKRVSISQHVHTFLQNLVKGEAETCLAAARKDLYQICAPEEQKAAAFLWLFEVKEHLICGKEEQIDREWRLWRNFAEIETQEELEKWLAEGMKMCCSQDGLEQRNDYIRKTCLFIDENFNRDISLEQASSAVGISYFYLSRLLKQEMNTTFSEMLTNIRLWRAVRLMKNPQKTAKEIGEETGYLNTTYFYKVFKKNTGISVGTMRKML